jgi:hypothetical protein
MTARKSSRVPTRSNTKTSQALHVNDFSPSKLTLPPQIPDVEPTIRITKRVQINVVLSSESGVASLLTANLLAGVPGGNTYWHKFRIERIDLWGDQSTPGDSTNFLRVTLAADSSWDQPNFQVTDNGTVGNERPRVAFRLGLLDRARWFTTADTTVVCLITGPVNTNVTIQATVELISPALTTA